MKQKRIARRKGKDTVYEKPWGDYLKENYDLYLMVLPALIFVIIFSYIPMYGVIMAFQDFSPVKGYFESPFVGLKHFQRFFSTYAAGQVISNTVILSIYSLIASFPFPVMLAIMLNYAVSKKFGKLVQTVTYMPNFISTMVLVGMLFIFFSPNYGVVNTVMNALGIESRAFMADPKTFRHIYVWSGIWQSTGYGSIIYFAALAGVDPTMYEAATLDGAGKLDRIRYIDLPTIMPTCVIMLILSMGGILGVGFEKTYLMLNPRNASVAEVISTYVYKVGLVDNRFSFSAAVSLFNTVVNFAMLIIVNTISKRLSETSLW